MPNETYTPDQMAEAIAEIGVAVLQTKTTTQNGTVVPDAGYDGLSSVTVNVSGNPNYVETITGILANPWGGDFTRIKGYIGSDNYTVYMTIPTLVSTGEADRLMAIKSIELDIIDFVSIVTYELDDPPYGYAFHVIYDDAGALLSESYGIDGQIFGGVLVQKTIDTSWQTRLTIIHHPLQRELKGANV